MGLVISSKLINYVEDPKLIFINVLDLTLGIKCETNLNFLGGCYISPTLGKFRPQNSFL